MISGGFDIIRNEVMPVPGPSRMTAQVLLAQGVVDTFSEARLVNAGVEGNAAFDFASDLNAGLSWAVIAAHDELERVTLPPDARAVIASQIDDGFLVVVPVAETQRTPVSWWRIDPSTGGALGFAENGWGAALGQYGIFQSSARIRGEGHAEYLVITGMLLVCGIAGSLSYFDFVRVGVERMALCFFTGESGAELDESGE